MQTPQQTRYTGMMHTFRTIVKEEKWHSLFKVLSFSAGKTVHFCIYTFASTIPHPTMPWLISRKVCVQGLEAGLHKQILYAGLRLGLYDYLTGLSGCEEVSMPAKIACATMTTGIGIMLANPSDVVQTRFIAHRSLGILHSSAASSVSPAPVSRAPVSGMAATPANRQGRHSSSCAAVRTPHSQGQRYMSSGIARMPLQHAVSSPVFQHQHATGGLTLWSHRHDLRHRSCLRSVGCTQSLCSEQLRGSHSACGVNAQNCTAGGPKSVTGVPLSNARRAYGVILQEEGLVSGLYRGIAANLSCSCVQGAAEITTYDFTKDAAMKHGFADSMPLHLAAGVTSPYVAVPAS